MQEATAEPIFYDSHMHTPLCKHAHGDPEEYAAVGRAAGLKGIIMTCHSPMPDNFWPRVRMSPDEFEEYVALVGRATRACEGEIDVRLGIEADFFPGTEPWMEKFLASAPFHYVLGSVHYFAPEYTDSYFTGDFMEFRIQYFEHLAESAETGLFDALAHPDLVKNADFRSWSFEALRETITSALDRIAKSGVAMELNTSGIHKATPEMNPGNEMLAMMSERGIPVVIGSDSHVPRRVGENFPLALENLRAAGYTHVSVFDERKRRDLAIAEVEATLSAAV